MIVLQILMLIFCMVILPFGIGVLPGRWLKKEDRTLTGIWISGYLVLFALFELVGIPVVLFTVYHGFSRLCLIFGLLAGVGFLAGVVRLLKKKEDYSSLLEGSFPEKRTVEEWVYLVLFALLLGFQLYMAFTRASFDGDDAYYGVQGLIAQQQDTLYRINPNTGRSAPLDIRHALALMPIYEAFLGKMSGIHATIIAHSAAPIGLILLTYEYYPRLEVIFGGHDNFRDPLNIDADEFIAVKGFKAKGKRITTYAVETINELEPTRFPEPSQEQQEVPEEEPENLDPDSGKSEGDIIDEITGQMKLF